MRNNTVHMSFIIAVIFLWLRDEQEALDWVIWAHQFMGLTNCKITLKSQ